MKNSIFEEEPVFLQNLIRFLVSPSLTSSGSAEEDFNFIQFEEVLNFSGGDTRSGGRAGAGRHAAVLHQHLQRGSPGKLQLLSDISKMVQINSSLPDSTSLYLYRTPKMVIVKSGASGPS